MKFHCERCKTRYSIADERVRGKILKVRCKNCSAVITVREGGQAVVPKVPAEAKSKTAPSSAAASGGQGGSPSRSALAGAFQQAMRRGMDSQRDAGESVSDAPADLDAEWFVSADGEQFGPFPLAIAKDWVVSQPMDEELFCWSEGFDDWLPIEKISHFRGLRQAEQEGARDTYQDERTVVDAPPENFQPKPASNLPPPKREDTPVPLFAATMAQVAAEAPTETEKDDPLGIPRALPQAAQPRTPPPAPAPPIPTANQSPSKLFDARPDSEKDAGDSLDLDIGEASRVVKLSMLAGAPGSAGHSAGGLPGVGGGIGRGSGSHPNLGGTADLPVVQAGVTSAADPGSPQLIPVKRRSLVLPLIIAGVLLVGIVAVLLVVTLTGEEGGGDGVARGRVAGQGLAYQYGEPGSGKEGDDGAEQVAGTDGDEGKTSGGRRAGATRRVIRNNTSGDKTSGDKSSGTAAVDTGDEVDLSGAGGRGVGELGPDDLFDVYQQYKVGVKMCYQSALKRDPLLRVRRADVFIRVNTQGTVTSASVPSLAGTPLGQCLEKRIKVWRFPKNSSGLNSKFPIMFDT